MNKSILIIGGGLAGLSAALQSLRQGYKPIILEKNRHTGGRVRSVFAQDLNRSLDNGQHVLSVAYRETRQFLNTISSSSRIFFQNNFETLFLRQHEKPFHFKALLLPAPWHFFLPLLFNKRFTRIPGKNYINFLRHQRALNDSRLRDLTVSRWLDHCRQGSAIRELFWNPLCLSVLNTPPPLASAWLLYRAVSQSFLRSRRFSGLGIPQDWLSEIFGKPAEKYIENQGGSIHRLTNATRLVCENNRIIRVETNKQSFTPELVIAAVPPHALSDLLENSDITQLYSLKQSLHSFHYHPIMTVNIYLREPLPINCPASVVASPLQWIFPHPQNGESNEGIGYALVVSAADWWLDKSREEVMDMILVEIKAVFCESNFRQNSLLAFKIIKEKKATVSQTPEFLRLRPKPRTIIRNLFLCGDWIDTDLPATIESAIVSGRIAVEEVAQIT
jgi:squalene-associated FAD-dependent desaturase